MSNKPQKYCLEYMITGVHSQVKQADCVFCSPDKYIEEIEKRKKEIEEREEREKLIEQVDPNLPNEEELDDAYEDLEEVAEDSGDDEEETKNAVVEKQRLEIESKLVKVQQNYISILESILKDGQGIELILDNTMGQVINPSNINENRFAIALRVLSLSLEKLLPEQNFNIFCTEQGVQLSKDLVEIQKIGSQKVDDFLLNINLHGKKENVIETLISRVKNARPLTKVIVVLTDFTSKNYKDHQVQIEEVIKANQNAPKIHIINFNLAGVESSDEKNTSFDFFRSIAQQTHGSFTGIVSLSSEIKQETF